MLEFCPMCKRLLVQKEENDKLIGICSCGFKRTSGITISGEVNIKPKETLCAGYIDDFKDKVDSSVEKLCLKCGFDRASVFEIAANESNIFVYKCLKCSSTCREVQGISRAWNYERF